MHDFLKGFAFIFRGFRRLRAQKSLLKWFIAPFLINLFLLVTLLSTGLGYVDGLVNMAMGYIAFDGWFFDAIKWLLDVIFSLAFILVIVYFVFIISTIVSSPFNAMMAEKVLLADGVIKETPFKAGKWIAFTFKMLWASLVKAVFFLGVAIAAFIISFLPGFNFVAIFASLIVIAFDCFDYSFEVMGLNFKQRKKFFMDNITLSSGMAASLFLAMFIPGLIILLLPLGVIGASSYVKDLKA